METFTFASLSRVLATDADLRNVYKQPKRTVIEKDIGFIDAHFRRFIELSPFMCLSSTGSDGFGDVTPRGGEPGFVHVLNEKYLAFPDRPGNNRLDALSNIVQNPGVGLLFFVPGFEDTLRANGKARITTDANLMERFTENGKAPLSVIVIEVHEIYLHCPKALKRSQLWNVDAWIHRETFPSAGTIYRDQLALEADVAAIDEYLDQDARDTLY